MKFYIYTTKKNDYEKECSTKEEFLKEIGLMINNCAEKGGTSFAVDIDTDVMCIRSNNTTPCDYGECPYNAQGGYDCRNYCGLGVDESGEEEE